MEKLFILNQIFSCIQESKSYQNQLVTILLSVQQKLRWIQLCKKKLVQHSKPSKSKTKRKRVPYHPAYQLLNLLKTKIKRPSFPTNSTLTQLENETLQRLFFEFPKDWKKISQKMKKPVFDCLLGYAQNNKQFSDHKKNWTTKEDNELLLAVEKVGTKNWPEVANYLDGKSGSSCFHRYMKMLNPYIKRGKWERFEDAQLSLSVKLMGCNWVAASKLIKTRTDLQCRERYCNVLSSDIDMSRWSQYDDLKLIVLVFLWGKKWSKIAKMFSGRTDNQCWRRSKMLVRNWELVRKLALARALKLNVPTSLKNFWVSIQVFKLV